MHLVYDIHSVFRLRGNVVYILAYFADIIDTVVRCRVYFRHIEYTAVENTLAYFALVAGRAVMRMLTVYRSCKNFCGGCFSCSASSAEEICMRYFAAHYLIFQGSGNMRLSDNIIKYHRPPFPVNSLICHTHTPFRFFEYITFCRVQNF